MALKSISNPGDSLVYGAIGVIGYYSELFMYDRFGLVTREVALKPRGDDEPLRAPGHDLKVSRSFFLKDRPTYIALAIFKGPDLGSRVISQGDSWRKLLTPRLWRVYAPDFVEVNERPDHEAERVIMVLRLIEEAPDDPIASLPRTPRRRQRAKRATVKWESFYARAENLPGQ